MRTIILCLAAAAIIITGSLAIAQGKEQNIYYILDASGSMWGQVEGTPKIEIAKSMLLDRIPSLHDQELRVGIVAYGHRRKGDCEDIEEIVELQPVNEAAIAKALDAIQPKGKTPIARSVAFVTDKLRALEAAAHVILISDGEESCQADPCEAVRQLSELGVEFTLDVIGFDLTPEQHEQLQCIAHAGGGRYFPASSAKELHEAILQAEEALPAPKVEQNVQIVLDRSQEMGKDFSGRRKIDVARNGISEKVMAAGAEAENLALRLVGGKCGDANNTRLELPFAINNGPAIKSRLDAVEIAGVPTLAAGLLASVNDFDDPRFDGMSKRVVVFTGSKSYCDPREMEAVYKSFSTKRIRPDVYFIAMSLPPNEMTDLRKLAGVSAGRIFEVENQQDFNRALDQIFDVEPVLASIRKVTDMLNNVIGHLNIAYRSIHDKNYTQAETEFENGRAIIIETDVAFRDLGSRQSRDIFKELYEKARENRQLQNQGFDLVDNLIIARQKDDVAAYNELIATANQIIGRYNENVRRLDELVRPLGFNE